MTAFFHQTAAIALPSMFALALGCGSSAAPPKEPAAAESIQSLLDQAEDAERQRDYHRARSLYLQAIDASPDARSAAIANREMASALAFWGEYAEAQERLQASLAHDPDQARVWHDLGIVQEHQGEVQSALRSLRRAVELAPREPRSRISYAALLVKEKRYTEAIDQYEVLLTLPIPPRIESATHRALEMLRAEMQQGS